jgi:hypothetical protein
MPSQLVVAVVVQAQALVQVEQAVLLGVGLLQHLLALLVRVVLLVLLVDTLAMEM